ncbi:MAG TPA: cytochrome c [Candidatus Acidoferrum sp.]|nr:cytochrome c [Candidatus Acidoferrum sp.]
MVSTSGCVRLVAATAVLAGVGFLCGPAANAQSAGEKVYKAKCAMCHGADGKGETAAGKSTKARDFCSDEVQKETDEEWTAILVKGKNRMPAYDKKLTDAEIKDVISYVRRLCKK